MGNCEAFEQQNASFRLVIQDVFTIMGVGIVVVGLIECGILHAGDVLTLHHGNDSRKVTAGCIEKYGKGVADSASQGENVGILLNEVTKDDVKRGDVLEM